MNIAEWRELGEALPVIARLLQETVSGCDEFNDGSLVLAAARLTYDRYQECETCSMSSWKDGECPSCGGSGLQPNQKGRHCDLCLHVLAREDPDFDMEKGLDAAVRAFDKETS